MQHKIIHHNDLDGCCSAHLVYKHLHCDKDITFIEVDYGRRVPEVNNGDDIWIVDFSFTPEIMEKWQDVASSVTWIDHHKSAVDKFATFHKLISGVRKDGDKSACALTHAYLYGTEMPYYVQAISNIDIHNICEPDDLLFYLGMQANDYSPANRVWLRADDHPELVINQGCDIYEYLMNEGVRYVADNGYWVKSTFGKVNGFVCNNGNIHSMKAYAPEADVWATFNYNPESKWTVILYSDTVNVEEIAKVFGGGGHPYAAGFQTNDIRVVLNR